MLGRKGRAHPSPEPKRVLLVEDDPDVVEAVRGTLESHARGEFAVESIASTRELRDRLARQALQDELTGVYSKACLIELLRLEARRVRRYGRELSCLMLDLDDFADIHESHGRQIGDALLKQVAALLQDAVREGDIVARYGDDEFCALLTETSLNAATAVAERVRFEIAAQPMFVEGKQLSVTASIGLCVVGQRHDHQPEAVLDRATAALKVAKSTGKNKVSAHVPAAQASGDSRQPVDLGQQSDIGADTDGEQG